MSVSVQGSMDIEIPDFLKNCTHDEQAEVLVGFTTINRLERTLRYIPDHEWSNVLEFCAEVIDYKLNLGGHEDVLQILREYDPASKSEDPEP